MICIPLCTHIILRYGFPWLCSPYLKWLHLCRWPRSCLWNLHRLLCHRRIAFSFDQEGLHDRGGEVHLLCRVLAWISKLCNGSANRKDPPATPTTWSVSRVIKTYPSQRECRLEMPGVWWEMILWILRAFCTRRPTSWGLPGENFPASLHCSLREASGWSEETVCLGPARFQQNVCLDSNASNHNGVSMYFPISISFLITKRYGEPFVLCSLPAVQRWWLPAKQLDSKVAAKTIGCHALPAWCHRWIHFILSSCNWAKTVHSRARDFHLQQGHALENNGLYCWN